MRTLVFDKGGYRYQWEIRGLDECGCLNDIEENLRTGLSDFDVAMFMEKYGCVAEVSRVRLMSHNQYQAFLQSNAEKLYAGVGYTLEDYRRDADGVAVLPFQLERFGVPEEMRAYIDKRFSSISYTAEGVASLRCHVNSEMSMRHIAEKLGCSLVCYQDYSGFYKNDSRKFILEYSEGDVSLILCGSQKDYAAQLAEFNRVYGIEDFDVCLEVYFDDVHMDNLFLPRGNVLMAISSLLQKGYEGYDESVKACWEDLLEQKKAPKLSFRVVETPTMVQNIDSVLRYAEQRSGSVSKLHSERDFVM